MKKLSFTKSLSLRLLLLTIGFVFIAEILIYVPSVANFRQTWLEEKIAAANIAILVIEAAPDYMVSRLLTDELLVSTQMTSITRKINEDEIRVLSSVKEFEINKRYDLRNATWWDQVRDAFTTMLHYQDHTSNIEVTDYAMTGKMEDIVIVFNEDLLCHEMYSYSWNIFFLSLAISLLTALFLYYSITKLLIRPVKVITESMISFRRAPEDQTNKYKPEERTDEIGVVMHELAEMQDEIRKALNQKNHLAKLGSAISKINHDLRNMLKSAQLVSEHLSTIKNPVVQKLLPVQPAETSDSDTMAPDYIFEPSAAAVLSEVLIGFTEVQVLQAVYESSASEHSARMVAMRNATEAANELVDDLTLRYNKARQEGITRELMDIIGGSVVAK